jgi:flagellar hook-associated protein FlgK
MTTKTWTVQVSIDEEGDDTRAEALLSLDNKMEMRGRGVSRRNPADESVPRIGDELATARALSDLAHQLLATAASDIESKTHVPASLHI